MIERPVEVALMAARPQSSSGLSYDVIDLDLEAKSHQEYQTPSLYINHKITWEISRGSVPNESHRIIEWENAGESKLTACDISYNDVDIAKRASQLITNYVAHRR